MDELSTVIQGLRTAGGFLLVAHGQSGDLGNSVQDNYNVAHENIQPGDIAGAIKSYINSKVFYEPIGNTAPYLGPILYGHLKKAGIVTIPVTRPIRRRVPRSGFFGPLLDSILGYQIRIEQRPEFQQVVQYDKSATLDTYLQSGSQQEAHFMAHYLQLEAPLMDHTYQRACSAPILYILGDEITIQKTVDYLKHNPAQYKVFMRALIPADMFPITNQLILNQLQNSGHTFLNLDKITERIRDEDLASICQRLGEK